MAATRTKTTPSLGLLCSSVLVVSDVFFVLLVITCSCLPSSSASPATSTPSSSIPAMYLFGDSLMDVGAAGLKFPYGIDSPSSKPDNRFSNGKNSADFLVAKLGLGFVRSIWSMNATTQDYTDDYLHGVNLAKSGAGIMHSWPEGVPLGDQVKLFADVVHMALVRKLGVDGARAHLGKSIVVFNIGTNDLLILFHNNNLSSVDAKSPRPSPFAVEMVSFLKLEFQRLYELGFRKLVFVGSEPVGCFPLVMNDDEVCIDQVNKVSVDYNDGIKSTLEALKKNHSDFNYSFFDTYTVFYQFIDHPEDYGFTDSKSSCIVFNPEHGFIESVCKNRDQYVFFDLLHQTQRTAKLLVDVAYSGSRPYVYPISIGQLSNISKDC